MIYITPGNTFEATLSGAPTGLTGTLGVRILNNAGGTTLARTTAGIAEFPAGSGFYTVTLTAPTTTGQYSIFWDTGSVGPTTTASEDLVVTGDSSWVVGGSSDAFITRTDLSDYLGRDVTTDNGALICVDAACDFVRDIAEQSFTRGTTTEYFDGTGTDSLLLPELPVNTVGTVSVSDSSQPPTWTTAGTADFALNGNGILYATDTAGTSLFGRTWPEGRQNIRVTYDHGYTTGDFPQSVRAVAIAIASRLFVQGPTTFEQLGDANVRYAAESTAVMPTEKAILRRYRRQ